MAAALRLKEGGSGVRTTSARKRVGVTAPRASAASPPGASAVLHAPPARPWLCSYAPPALGVRLCLTSRVDEQRRARTRPGPRGQSSRPGDAPGPPCLCSHSRVRGYCPRVCRRCGAGGRVPQATLGSDRRVWARAWASRTRPFRLCRPRFSSLLGLHAPACAGSGRAPACPRADGVGDARTTAAAPRPRTRLHFTEGWLCPRRHPAN